MSPSPAPMSSLEFLLLLVNHSKMFKHTHKLIHAYLLNANNIILYTLFWNLLFFTKKTLAICLSHVLPCGHAIVHFTLQWWTGSYLGLFTIINNAVVNISVPTSCVHWWIQSFSFPTSKKGRMIKQHLPVLQIKHLEECLQHTEHYMCWHFLEIVDKSLEEEELGWRTQAPYILIEMNNCLPMKFSHCVSC